MNIEKAADVFAILAEHGRDAGLHRVSATWQFDVKGAGTWALRADQGALEVVDGPADQPAVRVELSEPELLRIARGDEHENLMTALLRGAIRMEGDLRVAQRLQAILPIPEKWRAAA
jgi:ubiquinone biosynthesis protein UbiJ